jgi:N-acetylglucosaminyl-diphospho-decaprenol L-rhamnosyltransferase
MTLTVDVALVAYRRWDLTKSALDHLRRQTVPHRITLCDNGCDEGTAERIASGYPDVTVVRFERNMAYPIACNAAVAAGTADIVVMMNNDVDARPDFLERLTAPFDDDDRLGSAACLLLRPSERAIDSAGLVADPTLAGFPRFQGAAPPPNSTDWPVLTGPAGAAAAFRRSAWEGAGGLDAALPAYMEDLDLALRLRSAGWATTLVSEAVAIHVGSASFGKGSAGQRQRSGFGRGYVLRRYRILRSRQAPRALVTELAVILGDALISRDLAALRGRRAGWKAAGGQPARTLPPPDAIDHTIGLRESFRLRRASYRD